MHPDTTQTIHTLLEAIIQAIRHHLPDPSYQVLLFGSWARRDALPTSDIDIGILGKEPLDDLILIRLKEEINLLPTLRKIDVVDLRVVDDRFRHRVLEQGRVLT